MSVDAWAARAPRRRASEGLVAGKASRPGAPLADVPIRREHAPGTGWRAGNRPPAPGSKEGRRRRHREIGGNGPRLPGCRGGCRTPGSWLPPARRQPAASGRREPSAARRVSTGRDRRPNRAPPAPPGAPLRRHCPAGAWGREGARQPRPQTAEAYSASAGSSPSGRADRRAWAARRGCRAGLHSAPQDRRRAPGAASPAAGCAACGSDRPRAGPAGRGRRWPVDIPRRERRRVPRWMWLPGRRGTRSPSPATAGSAPPARDRGRPPAPGEPRGRL